MKFARENLCRNRLGLWGIVKMGNTMSCMSHTDLRVLHQVATQTAVQLQHSWRSLCKRQLKMQRLGCSQLNLLVEGRPRPNQAPNNVKMQLQVIAAIVSRLHGEMKKSMAIRRSASNTAQIELIRWRYLCLETGSTVPR